MTVFVPLTVVFFCSSLITFYLLKILIDYKKISNNNVLKRKKLVRWGNSSKSHLGGISFLISFLFVSLISNFFYEDYISIRNLEIIFLILLTCFFSLLDDILLLSAKVKICFQILISSLLIFFDFKVDFLDIYYLDLTLNILFFVAVFNITNFFDNFDGALTSLYLPIFFYFLIFSFIFNLSIHIKIISLVYIFSLVIFYFFNSFPSKIFMGDVGSSQIALLSIILGHEVFWANYIFTGYANFFVNFLENYVFYIILGIDSLFVIIYRFSIKKPIFIGDTNHLSHVFLKFLKKPYKFCLMIFISQLILISSGVFMKLSLFHSNTKLSIFLMILLMFLCIYAYLYAKNVKKL